MEYFVVANSNAAPFASDQSTGFSEGETPRAALEGFVSAYSHPAGLYAAGIYGSADDYHKGAEPLLKYLCAKESLRREVTLGLEGYSYISRDASSFEVNGKRFQVAPGATGTYS